MAAGAEPVAAVSGTKASELASSAALGASGAAGAATTAGASRCSAGAPAPSKSVRFASSSTAADATPKRSSRLTSSSTDGFSASFVAAGSPAASTSASASASASAAPLAFASAGAPSSCSASASSAARCALAEPASPLAVCAPAAGTSSSASFAGARASDFLRPPAASCSIFAFFFSFFSFFSSALRLWCLPSSRSRGGGAGAVWTTRSCADSVLAFFALKRSACALAAAMSGASAAMGSQPAKLRMRRTTSARLSPSVGRSTSRSIPFSLGGGCFMRAANCASEPGGSSGAWADGVAFAPSALPPSAIARRKEGDAASTVPPRSRAA
mmetsp:Transcript_65292/g.181541  ORF Transcript_65292/g.181541 Transcript_65292/m.181541 type:complete len:328 (+) Transcript_65292:530-1513(+)